MPSEREVISMIVELLARWWSVNDPLPKKVDLIVPIAHGATKKRLTRGARAVAILAARISQEHPEATIAYGAFTGSPNPKIEEENGEFLPRSVFVGNVISTIEECFRIRLSRKMDYEVATIIVVTDEAHSRRCKIVWKTFFPNSDIRIVAIPISQTIDKESPMWPYHHKWATLLFQALPTPYYWWLSLRGEKAMLAKATSLHQPVA